MNLYPVSRVVFTTGINSLKTNFDPSIQDKDLKLVLTNYKLAFAPTPAHSDDPPPPPDAHRPINDTAWGRTVRRLVLERDAPGMPRVAEVLAVFRREREQVMSERNGEAFVADLEARRAAKR